MSDHQDDQQPTISKSSRRSHRGAAIGELLQPGETVVRSAQISAAIYWKGLAVLVLALLVFIKVSTLGLYLLLVALIMLATAYMTRYYLMLVLTDKRVLVRRGILTLDTVQLRLNRIESVELEWTPMGRLLGYAIIVITGTGSRVVAVPYIAQAQAFRQEINERLLAMEDKPQTVIIQQAPVAPPERPV